MWLTIRALTERTPPPTPKFQPKVIWNSNPDFRFMIRIMPVGSVQNAEDALCCRRQSFCQVW